MDENIVNLSEARQEKTEVKKEKKPSPEFVFSQSLWDSPFFLEKNTAGQNILKMWNGKHHVTPTLDDINGYIQTWLKRRDFKGYFNDRTIKSIRSVIIPELLSLRKFIEKGDKVYISTRHCVLELTEDLKFVRHFHNDRIYARTYVDIDLNKTQMLNELNVDDSVFNEDPSNEVPERVQYITNTYEPMSDAKCEDSMFGRYIKSLLPNDEVRRVLQECLGDTLSPVDRQKVTMLIGPPGSGKSMLMKLMMRIHDRSVSADLSNLNGTSLQPAIGASLMVIEETQDKVSAKDFKRLVGGASIPVDRKYQEKISWCPSELKIVMGVNANPKFSDLSGAVEGRILPFQCSKINHRSSNQKIDDIDKIIWNEDKHKFFDWLLNGLVRVYQRDNKRGKLLSNENLPGPMKHSIDMISVDNDPISEFFFTMDFKAENGYYIPNDKLFEAFESFSKKNNRSVGYSSRSFIQRFRTLLETKLGLEQPEEGRIMVEGKRMPCTCGFKSDDPLFDNYRFYYKKGLSNIDYSDLFPKVKPNAVIDTEHEDFPPF